jgi:hypothetical protein
MSFPSFGPMHLKASVAPIELWIQLRVNVLRKLGPERIWQVVHILTFVPGTMIWNGCPRI